MRQLNRSTWWIFVLFHFFFYFQAEAQKSKSQLEREKLDAQKSILEAQQILKETTARQKGSLGQLQAINKQVEARQKLVRSIKQEMAIINDGIKEDFTVINALENDLKDLKEEYATMVYSAYKSSNNFSRLTFLFSSKSFDQLIMRLKYLQQYSKARKNQVRLITEVREELLLEKEQLEKKKKEKEELLAQQMDETKNLQKLKKEQNRVLTNLKSREKELRKQIAKRQNDVAKLEKLIAKIIREEIRKSNLASEKSKAVEINLSNLTASFEKNKTKLPWPTSSGFISGHFGTHPHPVYKGIKVRNDGINIQTKKNEKVKAVFTGKVKKIVVVPGMKYVILIQHGNYYTLYARLKEVYVQMGQHIEINDVLGAVNTDQNGVSELQFQIWKNTTKLNPETWLVKK
jgi:septal ring factor EnvC (AmiA/AmiB activator)